jgi:hypothetical protein
MEWLSDMETRLPVPERVAKLESEFNAMRESVKVANLELNRRLDGMNELRKQIEAERGRYVDRDTYSRENTLLADRIRSVELSLAKYAGGILFIAALINILAQFIGHYAQ